MLKKERSIDHVRLTIIDLLINFDVRLTKSWRRKEVLIMQWLVFIDLLINFDS
jgi:hypothetical protein